jgi:hypothetical protein
LERVPDRAAVAAGRVRGREPPVRKNDAWRSNSSMAKPIAGSARSSGTEARADRSRSAPDQAPLPGGIVRSRACVELPAELLKPVRGALCTSLEAMKPKRKRRGFAGSSKFVSASMYCTELLGRALKAGRKQSLHWPASSQSAVVAPGTVRCPETPAST